MTYIYAIIDTIISYLPTVLAVAIIVVCAIRFGLPPLTQRFARMKAKMTKHEFKVKQTLLALEGLVDLYAPVARYERDLREGETFRKIAWLSPYPRAVKASYKRYGRVAKGKVFSARKQIAEVAERVTVTSLVESDQIYGGTIEDHYVITLKLDGNAIEQVAKLSSRIQSQLGLHSIVRIKTHDNYTVSFLAHEKKPHDLLAEQKAGIEFFEEHSAKKLTSIPLAITERADAWNLPTHHTLILGTTGSGKGSPINGLIRQLSPSIKTGVVQLYGIDPKASELRPYEESSLFDEIVYENNDASEVIARVHRIMKKRAHTKKIDIANAQLGRSLSASKENPMIVLLIDELLSLLIALQGQGREGKASLTVLTEILAQGRSLGVYVVGATQEADKDLLGRMRGNFANVILLRQISPYINDLFLGEGAREAGYDSTAIAPANAANKYATAGIGFVKEETGEPVKVRFAYLSDEDIAALIREYPRKSVNASGNDDDFYDFSEVI